MFKKFFWFYACLVVIILIASLVFPKQIELTRNHIFLIVILFFIAIFPTLESGKISYLFEFKRNLEKAKKAVTKMSNNIKIKNDVQEKRAHEDIDVSIDGQDPCSATSGVRSTITQEMSRILKRHKPESRLEKPLIVLEDLRKEKVIDNNTAEAIREVLNLCQPNASHAVLSEDDIAEIKKTVKPVVARLKEII